jgi:hypothetical protein
MLNQVRLNQVRLDRTWPNLRRHIPYRFSLHNQVPSPVASRICIRSRSPASHSSCATRPPAQKLAPAHPRMASSALPRSMQLHTLSTRMRRSSAMAASKGLSLPAALNPACKPRWPSILPPHLCFRPQCFRRYLARPPLLPPCPVMPCPRSLRPKPRRPHPLPCRLCHLQPTQQPPRRTRCAPCRALH